MKQVLLAGQSTQYVSLGKILKIFGFSCADANAHWPPTDPYLLIAFGSEAFEKWLTKSRDCATAGFCLGFSSKSERRDRRLRIAAIIKDDFALKPSCEAVAATIRRLALPLHHSNEAHLFLSLISEINWHGLPSRAQDLMSALRERKPVRSDETWKQIKRLNSSLIQSPDVIDRVLETRCGSDNEMDDFEKIESFLSMVTSKASKDCFEAALEIRDQIDKGRFSSVSTDAIETVWRHFKRLRKCKEDIHFR
jgi:hypothetical protein